MAARLLLDTHALLWWCVEPDQLTVRARAAIADGQNMVFVSAVSAMEIATKFRIGKLPWARPLAHDFVGETTQEGFVQLPLTAQQAQLAGNLAIPHNDPFDRLLIAQAQTEAMELVSNEAQFDTFGVLRLW